jgi:hypothetical protein
VLRIACLHTAESNIAVFDSSLRDLGPVGVELRHSVRADLLAAAEEAGGLTSPIIEQTANALGALCNEADAVLLTCLTLGPAAEAAAESAPIPVLRVDAALAHKAVKDGGKVAVLCAVETTLEPTRLLFEKAAQATGAEIVMWLVPGAWEAFRAGDRNRYLSMIAQAADEATRNGAKQVALAQASMAGAVDLASTGRHLLNSSMAGLAAAIEAVRAAK